MPLSARLLIVASLLAACQGAPDDTLRTEEAVELVFELTSESGSSVSEADFSDGMKLVFFGFTTCPDICPITLRNVAVALRSLGDTADGITVLFISIDPHRDTPERLRLYTDAIHPSIVGLTGTWEQLVAVTENFRTAFGYSTHDEAGRERPLSRDEYERLPDNAAYAPFHGSQLYVVGRDGQLLDIIGYGSPPSRIEAVLRSHIS